MHSPFRIMFEKRANDEIAGRAETATVSSENGQAFLFGT